MKSQNLIIPVVILAILYSCSSVRYNKVYSYDDEFRGGKRKYVRLALDMVENKSEISDAHIILESSVGKQGRTTLMYFMIPRSAGSFRADASGFIGAGDARFELTLVDPVAELKTRTEESYSAVTSVDSTGTETTITSGSDTREWYEEKFMLRLTEEHRTSILVSPEVVFRFYFGPVPATYILNGRKLEMVKEVLR